MGWKSGCRRRFALLIWTRGSRETQVAMVDKGEREKAGGLGLVIWEQW